MRKKHTKEGRQEEFIQLVELLTPETRPYSSLFFGYYHKKLNDSNSWENSCIFQFLVKMHNQVKAGLFHRFCAFKHIRITETLSLEEKSLSLGKNPLIFMGEI